MKLEVTQCNTCSYITAHAGSIKYMGQGQPYCAHCSKALQEARDIIQQVIEGEYGEDQQ